MNRPNFFISIRLARIQEGHRKASKELMDLTLHNLQNGIDLSDEQRKYLLWGLKRTLDEKKKDPFNLRSGTLTGNDLYGALTKSETDWAAYLSVLEFMEEGKTLSEASHLAAKVLEKGAGINLGAGTIEKKYKSVKREFRCAEIVFHEVCKLGNDFGEDLETAVKSARIIISQSEKFSVTDDQVREYYELHKAKLFDQFDPSPS